MNRIFLSSLLAASALGACTLSPTYERPILPVAQSWPVATAVNVDPKTSADDLAWREVFLDPRLQGVIELAIANNRDLRVAALNIERARATYRVQRAALLPTIAATVNGSKSSQPVSTLGLGDTDTAGGKIELETYSASIGLAAYELDLFGRVRSLNQAALQSYFAVAETRRSAQISLIAEVANAYLTLAADEDLLDLSRQTLRSREESLKISQQRLEAGASSALDVRQAQTLAEQARSDAAVYVAIVEQDGNALRLLVGAEIPADLAPSGGLTTVQILSELPIGLPSDVLVRRPDVLSAEHALQAQNANIGAARAAFFPRIALTASTGSASNELDGLFKSGSGNWSFAPSISVPLFAGGANRAGLQGAQASRDIAIAQYERAVQTAFREVADALAVRATIDERLASQQRLVAAAADSQRLSQARYESGVDANLTRLDAERTLYLAQQSQIAARLVRADNLVSLYRSLGGGAEP